MSNRPEQWNEAPELTEEKAKAFEELGRPGLSHLVGQPVGVSVSSYRSFKQNGFISVDLDLDAMLDQLTGTYLSENTSIQAW